MVGLSFTRLRELLLNKVGLCHPKAYGVHSFLWGLGGTWGWSVHVLVHMLQTFVLWYIVFCRHAWRMESSLTVK